MTTMTFAPALPARAPAARRARTSVAGLVGALLRAALVASSSPDLDAAGVLRTAEANRRRA